MKKILIIGFGSIGKRHLRNCRQLLPDATIAVCRLYSKTDGKAPEGADVFLDTLESAVGFVPDAVIIASPASEHLKHMAPFLAAGVPIFVEKPLSADSSELQDFVQKVQASPSFVMVGYVLRFMPALHFIRDLLPSLGQVWTAHIQVGQYLPDWRPDTDYRQGVSAQKMLGGGALLELSHELDYALWLFGEPYSLQCTKSRLSDLEINVEDSAQVTLEYDKKRVCVQLDFLQRVAHMAIEIVGSEATLRADLMKEEVRLFTPMHPDGEMLACPKLENANAIYVRQFDFFFHRSDKDYKPVFGETAGFRDWVDIVQGARVMRLVDAAKIADEQGKRQMWERGE